MGVRFGVAAPAEAVGAPPVALGFAEGNGESGSVVALLAGFVAAAEFCSLSDTGFGGGNVTGLEGCGLTEVGLLIALSATP